MAKNKKTKGIVFEDSSSDEGELINDFKKLKNYKFKTFRF